MPQLAHLLWLHASADEQAQKAVGAFEDDLTTWCEAHALS
ncbi:MAG: hypothetical protein JWN77_1192, partial [Frankiales bacterium]|nr:hypothetical protein [Frankiales bacterium]